MKKIIALITLVALLLCSLTACGSKPADNTASVSALDAMTAIWGAHAEDQKFAIIGGSNKEPETANFEAPDVYDISDPAMVEYDLGLPESEIGKVTGAASIVHMMNANTFTAAAYDLAAGTDAAALANAIKDHLAVREWMCGFPEKLVVLNVNGVVISLFGAGDLIANFVSAAEATYEGTTTLVDTALEF